MLISSNLKEGLSRTVIPPIFKRVKYNYLKKKKKKKKRKEKRERETHSSRLFSSFSNYFIVMGLALSRRQTKI